MREIATQDARQLAEPTPQEVASDLERLTHLLPSLRACSQSRDEARAVIASISQPAEPVWMMARVAALLLPYYEKDTPQAVRMIEAEDWALELCEFPKWAIEKAVRWWKSKDNDNRRKRPLEGDISARARFEMGAVNAARIAVNGKLVTPKPDTPEPVSEADREYRKSVVEDVMSKFRTGRDT
jgi:hypothetical protein